MATLLKGKDAQRNPKTGFGLRGTYVAKGRIRFFFGPEGNQQVIDTEAGDYIWNA